MKCSFAWEKCYSLARRTIVIHAGGLAVIVVVSFFVVFKPSTTLIFNLSHCKHQLHKGLHFVMLNAKVLKLLNSQKDKNKLHKVSANLHYIHNKPNIKII